MCSRPNEFLVRDVEVFLPDALGRDHAGEGVSGAALCRDNNEELAAVLVQEAIGFANRSGEIRQVFEDVDGNEAVKVAVGERKGFLAVTDYRSARGGTRAGYRQPCFRGIRWRSAFLLLGREFLVVDVLAETGARLRGSF